jgi:hypothetical protein
VHIPPSYLQDIVQRNAGVPERQRLLPPALLVVAAVCQRACGASLATVWVEPERSRKLMGAVEAGSMAGQLACDKNKIIFYDRQHCVGSISSVFKMHVRLLFVLVTIVIDLWQYGLPRVALPYLMNGKHSVLWSQ